MLTISSLGTEIFFWLLTLVAFSLTVIFWNKLSPRNGRHVAGRVSAMVLIQCLALASTALTVNRAGEFYASWGDLFGSKNQLAKVALAPDILAQISASDIEKADRTPGGSLILRKIIKGKDSGISDVVYVALPPKMATKMLENPSAPTIGDNYQVVELFPGFPGVPQTWIGSMAGITTLENLENSGTIKESIAIIPAINVMPGEDTECLDFIGGPQVETWITSDMREFAKTYLGVDSRRWSAFGFSTGGWCASEVAIRHPDLYKSAVSLAGYFKPTFSLGVSKRERKFLTTEYDLIETLKSKHPAVDMLVIASNKDRFTHQAALDFLKASAGLLKTRYIAIPEGGHNTRVWKPFVPTAYEWIDKEFNALVSTTP